MTDEERLAMGIAVAFLFFVIGVGAYHVGWTNGFSDGTGLRKRK